MYKNSPLAVHTEHCKENRPTEVSSKQPRNNNKKMSKYVACLFLLAFVVVVYADSMENFIALFTKTACEDMFYSAFNQAVKACGKCISLTCSTKQVNPLQCGIKPE
ncbi:hypothetical protein AVEN_269707-1 [Araneus ventricosus]|uniref:Uncharacterized protein n=1 Tax=Araneus ventricosus TaxID=182803 RepID=A0A4Y2KPY3_ARAVE|nr:hypothetical protein AVEN_269707-1 [Araneus ventricosus]